MQLFFCELAEIYETVCASQRIVPSKTVTLVTCDFKASNVEMRRHIKARHKLNTKKGGAKKPKLQPYIKTVPEDLSMTEEIADLRNSSSSINCDWLPCYYKSNKKIPC